MSLSQILEKCDLTPGKTFEISCRFFRFSSTILAILPPLRRVVFLGFFAGLRVTTKARLQSFGRLQSDPFISSIYASTMIAYSNSLCRERDAHSVARCSTAYHFRYRAFPRANRTRVKVSTRGHSATSSISELPSFVPSLPWQCSVAGASLDVDSGAASPRYNVRRPVLPPPARNAIRNCLVW